MSVNWWWQYYMKMVAILHWPKFQTLSVTSMWTSLYFLGIALDFIISWPQSFRLGYRLYRAFTGRTECVSVQSLSVYSVSELHWLNAKFIQWKILVAIKLQIVSWKKYLYCLSFQTDMIQMISLKIIQLNYISNIGWGTFWPVT